MPELAVLEFMVPPITLVLIVLGIAESETTIIPPPPPDCPSVPAVVDPFLPDVPASPLAPAAPPLPPAACRWPTWLTVPGFLATP